MVYIYTGKIVYMFTKTAYHAKYCNFCSFQTSSHATKQEWDSFTNVRVSSFDYSFLNEKASDEGHKLFNVLLFA